MPDTPFLTPEHAAIVEAAMNASDIFLWDAVRLAKVRRVIDRLTLCEPPAAPMHTCDDCGANHHGVCIDEVDGMAACEYWCPVDDATPPRLSPLCYTTPDALYRQDDGSYVGEVEFAVRYEHPDGGTVEITKCDVKSPLPVPLNCRVPWLPEPVPFHTYFCEACGHYEKTQNAIYPEVNCVKCGSKAVHVHGEPKPKPYEPYFPKPTPEAKPAPVEWQAGDWAIDDDDELVELTSVDPPYYYAGPDSMFAGSMGHLDQLNVPTRAQLARHIGDSGVMAWAWEKRRVGDVLMCMDDDDSIVFQRTHTEIDALGLIIVSAGQVERHYAGQFPPEE